MAAYVRPELLLRDKGSVHYGWVDYLRRFCLATSILFLPVIRQKLSSDTGHTHGFGALQATFLTEESGKR